MKNLILILIISSILFLDKTKRSYSDDQFYYEFHVAESNDKIKLKPNKRFYWYDYNKINSSVNGFSGLILNGDYKKTEIKTKSIIEKGKFKKGLKEQKWKTWYSNGNIKKIESWKKGLRSGSYELYDVNSNLLVRGVYKKGKKSGTWRYINGDTVIIKNWSKDKLSGKYKKYIHNVLVKSGKYLKGTRHGVWKDFSNKKEKKYKKGKLVNDKEATLWQRLFKKKEN